MGEHDRLVEMVKAAVQTIGRKDAEIAQLRAALTLAEDVLSRSPYSTDLWPNGMHPNRGITIIREALAHPK